MPIAFPLINGVRHEWSSAELKIKEKIYQGIKEVSYNDKLEPTKVYGVHAQPIGRTRGVYSAEGSITVYLEEYDLIINDLGDGFMEVPFDIVSAFTETNVRSVTDTLVGCRFKGNDHSMSQGADPLVRKIDLDIMFILWNGKSGLKVPLVGLQQ